MLERTIDLSLLVGGSGISESASSIVGIIGLYVVLSSLDVGSSSLRPCGYQDERQIVGKESIGGPKGRISCLLVRCRFSFLNALSSRQ